MSVKKRTPTDTVVTSADIQVAYEHLYSILMDFLWEFHVVQDIANLEISIFQKFPDKNDMQRCLQKLKFEIQYTYNALAEDDKMEFKEAIEDLEQIIEDYDEENTGCELYAVEEVVDVPKPISSSEDIDVPNGKHKFEIGDIKKTTKEERELQEEAARTLSNPFENEESEE